MTRQQMVCDLARRYLAEGRHWAGVLREAFGEPDLLKAWKRKRIPTEGEIGGETSYYFHGGGCTVEHQGATIDFEFEANGDVLGFDAWRLKKYLASRNVVTRNLLLDLDSLLEELERARVILKSERVPGAGLFRFTEDLGVPSVPSPVSTEDSEPEQGD